MKVDINPEQLAATLAQAVGKAVLDIFATKTEPVKPEKPIKKKRGRPSKQTPKTSQNKKKEQKNSSLDFDNYLDLVDEDDSSNLEELLNEPAREIKTDKRPSYIAPSRVPRATLGAGNAIGNASGGQSIVDPNRRIKFLDYRDVPALPTPEVERTERRAPVKKQKFTCSSCHREFEAYWSEMQSALQRYKNPVTGITEAALVRCDACLGG